jgi:4-alpha-glucanotransferase
VHNYDYLLNTKTAGKWARIGVKRRAGAAVPLFSIYSENSAGIGEIPDLKLLIDWCNLSGLSIVQLLPLNDVGSDFAPYNSQSTLALDPMYLCLNKLEGVDCSKFEEHLQQLKIKYRPRFGRVNYRIKKAKLDLLWDIFNKTSDKNSSKLISFIDKNEYWIKDYAIYKVISESLPDNRWELWNDSLKYRNFDAISEIESNNSERINFHYWVQWQLFTQLRDVKSYASESGVLLMGDLPFLVSRESADVWAHQEYFRLELSAGAPPDMYFALGQKWGMPPYNWDNIANDGFIYIKEKLKYAENFYDMYRIDHFVGLFRVWTSRLNDYSAAGCYLPTEEHLWELHGRRILDEMINASSMLPCAEDLGTVPECSFRVLQDYGIPGIDFQRFMKSNFDFRRPREYRTNSCSVLSTHDSTFFTNWWQFEAGTIDEKLFEIMFYSQSTNEEHYRYVKNNLFDMESSKHGRLRWKDNIISVENMLGILKPEPHKANDFSYLFMESYGEKNKFMQFLDPGNLSDDVSVDLLYKALQKANESNSIFSIQLLHEYLCLVSCLLNKISKFNYRINTPGKVSRNNWSIILPVSLENLTENELVLNLRTQLTDTKRI